MVSPTQVLYIHSPLSSLTTPLPLYIVVCSNSVYVRSEQVCSVSV